MTIAPKNEPKHEVTREQLVTLLESIEEGNFDLAKEWLRAAINFCEGGEWDEDFN